MNSKSLVFRVWPFACAVFLCFQGCGKIDVEAFEDVRECLVEEDLKIVGEQFPDQDIKLYDIGSADGLRIISILRENSVKSSLMLLKDRTSDDHVERFFDETLRLTEEAKLEELRLAERYRLILGPAEGARRIYWYESRENGRIIQEGVLIVSDLGGVVLKDDWSQNDRLFPQNIRNALREFGFEQ